MKCMKNVVPWCMERNDFDFTCSEVVCGPSMTTPLNWTPMFEWYLYNKVSSYAWTPNHCVLEIFYV